MVTTPVILTVKGYQYLCVVTELKAMDQIETKVSKNVMMETI